MAFVKAKNDQRALYKQIATLKVSIFYFAGGILEKLFIQKIVFHKGYFLGHFGVSNTTYWYTWPQYVVEEHIINQFEGITSQSLSKVKQTAKLCMHILVCVNNALCNLSIIIFANTT